MDKEKTKFAKNSLLKSANFDNDPMIQFIILWIGFNALYDDGGGHEDKKVSRYFGANANTVVSLLERSNVKLKEVANFIDKTPQHAELSKVLKTRRSFLSPNPNDNSVDDFSQFIYQIRNNMFHAGKSWNQEDEDKLLQMINPVFKDMLSIFVSNSTPNGSTR